MNAAALLPLPVRPPHDPQVRRLGGTVPFAPVALSESVAIDSCIGIALAPAPETLRTAGEPGGSFGGRTLPPWLTLDPDDGIWLLSRGARVLGKFDPCVCCFVTVPCTGVATGARAFSRPQALLAWQSLLLVSDRDPGRLLVFDRQTLALRAIWQPPGGIWSPGAMTVSGRVLHVADPTAGAIHRFAASGTWLGTWTGLGAIDALAAGPHGLLHAAITGTTAAWVIDPATGQPIIGADPARLGPPPFTVAADGRFELGELCKGAGWFDAEGAATRPPPPPKALYVASGTIVFGPIDSGIDDCVWHRIEPEAEVPDKAALVFTCLTAPLDLSAAEVASLPESSWTALAWTPGSADALFDAPPGRYLWLRASLSGDGQASPRLCSIVLESPRISLGRYLPAAFAANAEGAGFLDRMLALFDTQHRSVERQVDQIARLFDPLSAPTGGKNDVLGWLAAWLALPYERRWPEARRRALVADAGPGIAWRGTPRGLRQTLLAWLGWNARRLEPRPESARAPCGPRCAGPTRVALPPLLVLEHWKLRRWLWLGKGRVGSDAYLWGESILGRSRLGDTARAGVTRLDTTGNPLVDPLAEAANRISIFLPARCLEQQGEAAAVARLVDDHRPAHVAVRTVAVHARMRIGVQASIGLDAVVGCWPAAARLGRDCEEGPVLGRTTVVGGRHPRHPPQRLGQTSILTPQPRPRAAAQGKASA